MSPRATSPRGAAASAPRRMSARGVASETSRGEVVAAGASRFLTYRANKGDTLHAAYRGDVRVGYVTVYGSKRVMWNLIFLRPVGGQYMGWSPSLDQAKIDQEAAIREWTKHALLKESNR